MNSKNKIEIIILAVVCFALLYCNLIITKRLNEVKGDNILLSEELEKQKLSGIDKLCYSNNVVEVVRQFHKYQNKSDTLYKQVPILIYRYRYSQYICDVCIKSELDVLNSFMKDIGKDHVWVLPALEDTRENRIKLLSILAKFNYRNIPIEDFNMPMDCAGVEVKRFFALITTEGNIDMIFFPESSTLDLTKQYLSEILKKIKPLK